MLHTEQPFYIKYTLVLLGLIMTVFVLHILSDILIPFAIAALFAMLLNPLNNKFERRLPRILAILLTLLIAIAVIAGVFYLLSTQIARFSNMLPMLKQKFAVMLDEFQHWLQWHFGVSIRRQVQMMDEWLNGSEALVGRTVYTILGTIGVMVLIPFYVFLLLFYKPLILNFFYEVFKEKNALKVADILTETKSAVQSYLVGLMIETVIVAILNTIALLILDVPYAILLGIICGLVNLLPYIGGIIAILLPVTIVTIMKDGYTTQLAIILVHLVIQFIDNNILVPRIVSKKVKINALITILIVLMGGAIWGISGMFLAIPFVAVFKIIFDRIDGLKPWGKLLGDEVPTEHLGIPWQKRLARIMRRKEKTSV